MTNLLNFWLTGLFGTKEMQSLRTPYLFVKVKDALMKDNNGGGDETVRLIVDMDFRSQFELARPTSTYSKLTASLRSIFVGSEEKLMEIICLVCLENSINNFLKTTQRWNLDLILLPNLGNVCYSFLFFEKKKN
ncbi:hypothetical protein HYC85_000908 [Camellia sinensis]|uniref:Uncharacterized protein n=1 Tax=Camellia sinensis TaxID=4442 RepID=A0A7J7I440_CAMSI|nr:hypothetical protein HYC85_000908 [Camellia sinensis]